VDLIRVGINDFFAPSNYMKLFAVPSLGTIKSSDSIYSSVRPSLSIFLPVLKYTDLKHNVSIPLAIAWPTDACSPRVTAVSVIDRFPDVKSMGPTIEGASVDKFGNLLALNHTHFMNLSDAISEAPALVGGNTS
jgi:hypothetical protein